MFENFQNRLDGRDALAIFAEVAQYRAGVELVVSAGNTSYYRAAFDGTGELNILGRYQKVFDEHGDFEYHLDTDSARTDGWAFLEAKAQRGKGIFFKPHDMAWGGLGKDAFTGSRFIFAEDDERSFEEQVKNLADIEQRLALNLNLKIHSGGKSVHAHYLLDRTLNAEDWTRLNSKFCALIDGDSAVNTLGRNMRLPGFSRGDNQTWLLDCHPMAVSPEKLEAAIDAAWPHPQPWTEKRWEIFKKTKRAIAAGKETHLSSPEQAFIVAEDDLEPKSTFVPVQSGQGDFKGDGSGNAMATFLTNVIAPKLAGLPLTQQYAYAGYDHKFNRIGRDQYKGCSPFSPTNSSGTAFSISPKGWKCFSSGEAGQIVQYYQLMWYGGKGNQVNGKDFIDFVKRLAEVANVTIPQELLEYRRERTPEERREIRLRKREAKKQEVKKTGASASLQMMMLANADKQETVRRLLWATHYGSSNIEALDAKVQAEIEAESEAAPAEMLLEPCRRGIMGEILEPGNIPTYSQWKAWGRPALRCKPEDNILVTLQLTTSFANNLEEAKTVIALLDPPGAGKSYLSAGVMEEVRQGDGFSAEYLMSLERRVKTVQEYREEQVKKERLNQKLVKNGMPPISEDTRVGEGFDLRWTTYPAFDQWMEVRKSGDEEAFKAFSKQYGAQVFSISKRNPTNLAMENIPVTPTYGPLREDFDNPLESGKPRLMASTEADATIEASCVMTSVAHKLAEKGVDVHRGKNSPLCDNCTHYAGQIHKCPALKAKADSKVFPVRRANVDEGDARLFGIWDEVGQAVKDTHEIFGSLSDIDKELADLMKTHPSTYATFHGLIAAIVQGLHMALVGDDGKTSKGANKYGLSGNDILQLMEGKNLAQYLPHVENEDGERVVADCIVPLSAARTAFLHRPWTLTYAADVIDEALKKGIDTLLQDDSVIGGTTAEEKIDSTTSRVIPRILRFVDGHTRIDGDEHDGFERTSKRAGDVRIDKRGKITFTYGSSRHQATIRREKCSVMMDATARPSRIAQMTGVKARDIVQLSWTKHDNSNLTFLIDNAAVKANFNRQGETSMGEKQRCVLAAEAARKHLLSLGCKRIGLIEQKKHIASHGDNLEHYTSYGSHYSESRGSNKWIEDDAIVFMGPCASINLGALTSASNVRQGTCYAPDNAPAHYGAEATRIGAENCAQGGGRLRGIRRPEKHLYIAMVGAVDKASLKMLKLTYPGCNIKNLDLGEIDSRCLPQVQQTSRLILESLADDCREHLTRSFDKELGPDAEQAVSMRQLQGVTGKSKATCARHLAMADLGIGSLNKGLMHLRKNIYRGMRPAQILQNTPPELVSAVQFLLETCWDEIQQGLSPSAVAADMANMYQNLGHQAFLAILDTTSPETLKQLTNHEEFRLAMQKHSAVVMSLIYASLLAPTA